MRRCKRGGTRCSHCTARRCRQHMRCTARRCYGRSACTVCRYKQRVLQRWSVLVRAALKGLGRTRVVPWQSVERLPRQGIPAGLVRAVTFDHLMDEARFDQLALGASDYVAAFPPAFGQVGGRCLQAPVVVEHELARQLQEQRACGVAEAQERGAIQYGPGEGDKPPRVSARALLAAFVAAVSHGCRHPIAAVGPWLQTLAKHA